MKKSGILEASADARVVIAALEKALKKHISLVKKRERVASIVAYIERLRGDLASNDVVAIRKTVAKLNELTSGFVKHMLKK